MKGLAQLVAVLAIVVFATSPASADSGWTIQAFNADITIRGDGSLAIVEAIDVDFGGLQKHGILRDVPTRYRYDDTRDRLYRLTVQRVTDATGRGVTYQVSPGSALTEIKIGDPGRTVSGRQSYRIAYTVEGALNAFADHDELYWNVNGDQWGVPTLATSARVTAPAGAIGQTACFQGPTGATETCKVAATSFTATRPFAAGEQLTIVASLAKGAIAVAPPILVDRPRTFVDHFSTSPLALAAAAVVLVAGLFAVWWLWWTRGRDRGPARGAIVAEYEPPDKLRPAQLGVIVDESADPRDLVATIVDLAVRGYLTITEHQKQGLFGHTDWTLDKKKPADDLLAYERRLFEGLFKDGDSVLLSCLKGTFAPTLKGAEDLLYKDAMQRGWFVADPSRVRVAYAGVGCLTVVVGIGVRVPPRPARRLGLRRPRARARRHRAPRDEPRDARADGGRRGGPRAHARVQALHGHRRDRPRRVRREGRSLHRVPPVRGDVRQRRPVAPRLRRSRCDEVRLELVRRPRTVPGGPLRLELHVVLDQPFVHRRVDARGERRQRVLWRLLRRRWWRRGRRQLVSGPDRAALTALVEAAMAKHVIPGVAIGVVDAEGPRTFCFGITNVDHPLPVDPDTVFEIASITKTMTATVAARLAAEGKLDLDAPVRRYLTDLRTLDPAVTDRVTVRDLFTHTAGWFGEYLTPTGSGDDALARGVAQLATLEMVSPVGLFSYNNVSLTVAGRVIEVVTDMSYQAAMRELLFEPLEMTRSTFYAEEILYERLAAGHTVRDGAAVRVRAQLSEGRVTDPAGGVRSTVNDLLRYARFHLGDGTTPRGARLMPAAALAAMREPRVPTGARGAVGLSWFLGERGGVPIAGHGGATVAHMSLFLLVPDRGAAFVVLTNGANGPRLNDEVAEWLQTSWLGLAPRATPAPLDPQPDLAQYAGRYWAPLSDIELAAEDDRLVLRLAWKGAVAERPIPAPMRLALSGPDAVVVDGPGGLTGDFIRGPDGKLAYFRWGARARRKVG